MNQGKFGELFRELRLIRGLTQLQLAEGVCSERHIKNIENGRNCPSVELICSLSRKLGNNIYEIVFLSETNINIADYRILIELNRLYKTHCFQQLFKLLQEHEEQLCKYESPHLMQILKWYKGVYYGSIEKNYDKCKNELLIAWYISYPLSQIRIDSKFLTKSEIHIFNSMASNEYTHGKYKLALEMYKQLSDFMNNNELPLDQSFLTRVYYNIAKCLNKLNK